MTTTVFTEPQMRVRGALSALWWSFVVRGVLAIAFGLLTWILPAMSLMGLIVLFGVYAMVEGILAFGAALRKSDRDRHTWWSLALQGLAGTLAGAAAILVPGITALVLLAIIAARAVVMGILQVVAAIRLRDEIAGGWLLALGGVMSAVVGILMILFPGAGALALVLWIGSYSALFGLLLIAVGLRIRSRLKHSHDRPDGAAVGGAPQQVLSR
jgi:uncharacterized membrane protein HdeD (DUF308 family)